MKKIKLFSAVFIAMALMSGAAYAQYVTIYSENMGSTTTNTPVDTNVFQNLDISYSATATDVRATSPSANSSYTYYPNASGEANLFMSKDSASVFIASGISTEHFKNIELTFGLRKEANVTTLSDLVVEYSTDGANWTPITITQWERWKNGISDNDNYTSGTVSNMPTTSSTGWYFITCAAADNNIPAVSSLYLKIGKILGSDKIRIDDITLTGEATPYFTINEPENGQTYGLCDSIEINIDVQNFNFTTSLGGYMVPGDGFLKIESQVIDIVASQFGVSLSSPVYCDKTIMGMINNLGKFQLPEDTYTFTVSLVDNDSILIDNLTETVTFTVQGAEVATPVFSLESGAYHMPTTVEITCETEGAEIYYTTDGTVPSKENGYLYEGEIEITDSTTIMAIAYAECAYDSKVAEATYTKDVTGVADFNANNVAVYPNPATNVLNVMANGYSQVDVINFLGQVVYSSRINDSNVQINVNNLNSGIYFVRLQNAENTVTKKFIKK
ncbi:MAG: T9SS type A sorting domain-containing protein [Bacteroidales bacterium]|nr:T9SS type A sorting domain-containing protein [Bacteroidales bacterium]